MTKLERLKAGEEFYCVEMPFKDVFKLIENLYITLNGKFHCSVMTIDDKEIKAFSRLLNKPVNETILLDDIKFHNDDKDI